MGCLCVHISSAKVTSRIKQAVYNTGSTSGRNLKDVLCIYGGRLVSGTLCIPCDLCFLK